MNPSCPYSTEQSTALDLLTSVVRIPSVSGEEASCAAFLKSRARELGFVSSIDAAGNVVMERSASPSAEPSEIRTLMFLGHMDTVPGQIPVWIQDRKLYGRGSVDAKGPLAAFIMAAARVEPPPGTRVIVVAAVDEERSSDGARYISKAYGRPEACIIGEPSGVCGITLGYKGILNFSVNRKMPAGHSAGPESSAPDDCAAFWSDLLVEVRDLNRGTEKVFDQISPTITAWRSGDDGLQASAGLRAKLRLPSRSSAQELLSTLSGLADRHGLDLDIGHSAEAYHASRGSDLVNCLQSAVRESGGAPRYLLKTGTSDMNIVGPAWDVPICAYGPGDSRLDHSPDEHIEIEAYFQAIDILEDAINKYLARMSRSEPVKSLRRAAMSSTGVRHVLSRS